jgi:hypothetical protein
VLGREDLRLGDWCRTGTLGLGVGRGRGRVRRGFDLLLVLQVFCRTRRPAPLFRLRF